MADIADIADFTQELAALLTKAAEAQDSYYPGLIEAYAELDAIEHVTAVPLDERRWYTVKLDVYRRKADGALAGVRWNAPATEEQEGQDRDPEAVLVEQVLRPTYRVVD